MGLQESKWEPAADKSDNDVKFKYRPKQPKGPKEFGHPTIIPLCERTDLPPEAKALIFTLDTLPIKGGPETSMWYKPPESKTTTKNPSKSPSANPEVKGINPLGFPNSVSPSKRDTKITSASSLDPAAKGFTPANTLIQAASSKSDAETTSTSSLDPAVKDFTPGRTLTQAAPPKSDGGQSSFSTLDSVARPFIRSAASREAEVSIPVSPTIAKGLNASSWARSASNSSKDTELAVMDPMSPLKARDVPVHLRGYFIAPHLRPAGLKALPGKPLLPYVEPHQRVGILPEIIPNDAEYHTPSSKTSEKNHSNDSTPNSSYSTVQSNQVPTSCMVIASSKNGSHDRKENVPSLSSIHEEIVGDKTADSVISIPKTSLWTDFNNRGSNGPKGYIPFLASSFEEFTGCKTLEEYNHKLIDSTASLHIASIPTPSAIKHSSTRTPQMIASKNDVLEGPEECAPPFVSSCGEFIGCKTVVPTASIFTPSLPRARTATGSTSIGSEGFKESVPLLATSLGESSGCNTPKEYDFHKTAVHTKSDATACPATDFKKIGLEGPKKHVPFLASSFEEFTGCKTLDEYNKRKTLTPKTSVLTASVPTISSTTGSGKRGPSSPEGRDPLLPSSCEVFTGCKILEEYSTKAGVPVDSAPSASMGEFSNKNDSNSPEECIPFLASSLEDSKVYKTLEDYDRKKINRKAPSVLLTSSTNINRGYIQLPSDCYSSKLAPDRKAPKLQPKIQLKETVAPEGLSSGPGSPTVLPSKGSQIAAAVQTEKVKQPCCMKSKVSSTTDLHIIDTAMQQIKSASVEHFEEALDPPVHTFDSNPDAVFPEMEDAKDPFAACIAGSEGIDPLNSNQSLVGDSRGYLARIDEGLHYNGNWMPVVCSWENDRPEFNYDFIPQYITEWAKTVSTVTGKVDTNREEFMSGLAPLSLLRFEDPPHQPPCYPDLEQSDNRAKQLVQTAEINSKNLQNRVLKKQRMRERHAQISARQSQIAIQSELFLIDEELIVSANIPKINLYLRPAEIKDISGITSIYNHYVLNSITTEDQIPINEKHMISVLKDAQEQGLPFIVAIEGKAPVSGRAKCAEHVLGFAHTDFLNYGHSGSHIGASRFSGIIHLYVDPDQTRKGVGRSLLDRILVCSSSTHASKEGYQWVSPKASSAAVYGQQGGAHKFHQLFFHRHIEVKEDPDHEWLKQWLHSKFLIEEVARFKSAVRSSNRGTTARMLDLLVFQFEAATTGGYDINH